MKHEEKVVPCKICLRPTPMLGTKLCDACWEASRGLEHLIKYSRGRELIQQSAKTVRAIKQIQEP